MIKSTSKLTELGSQTTISEIMSRSTFTVEPKDSVQSALRIMVDQVNTLPVVDENRRCVGIISRTDLSESFYAEDKELARFVNVDGVGYSSFPSSKVDTCDERRVYELMNDNVIVATTSMTIVDACELMTESMIHHLPVVDEKNKLIGMVSSFDIVRWLVS